MDAVALTGKPFDAVAVYGVAEFLFGGGYEYLGRCAVRKCIRLAEHPVHTIGKQHETVSRLVQAVDEFFAAQAFLFAEGVHGVVRLLPWCRFLL